MVSNKTTRNIKYILEKYNLGNLLEISLFNSSQNLVYKVVTTKNDFVIKEFSKDAITNYYYLKKRKEQIRVSKILNKNGISTITPIEKNKKSFSLFNGHYYLVYNFYEDKPLSREQLNKNKITILARTQARIHKLNIKSSLPCSYRYIKIDLDKQIKIARNVNQKLLTTLNKNKIILDEMIKNCNEKIKIMKDNLCISHNDYKLLNILWNGDKMTLIDFDAMGLSNPTCCLCESSYTFAKASKGINLDYYREYLTAYLNEYGDIKENYKDALYASFNGKLQWLSYMFSKNHLKKNNYIEGTIDMIESLVNYYKNIDILYNVYDEILKK